MADALGALDAMNVQVAALLRAATEGRHKYISSGVVQPISRALAKAYFEGLRAELSPVQNRPGLIEDVDRVVQSLLQLAEGYREKQAYIGLTSELRPYLREATFDLMKAGGTPRLVLSQTEQAILATLADLLPGSAASYEQVLRDISQAARVSWRGTAAELREVKARRSGSAAVATAEASLDTIDEAVAGLARSTYQRGAVSTHVPTTGKEVRSLKRYVDALLAELLEVS